MLLNIYVKEMKDSFRDRRTLLLTVLLPIFMMTGLTLFYENLVSSGEGETYTLAVSETATKEELSIVQGFEGIDVVSFADPEEAVKQGEAKAALLFDESFLSKVENHEEVSVTIVGDSSSQNSSILMSMVTTALSTYEKYVVAERLQVINVDQQMIQPFTVETKEVTEENPALSLIAMMIPLFIALAIGIGSSPAASELFSGEKEKKTMEALLMTPVNRGTLLLAKWFTIITIGSITGIVTLIVVALEITFFTETLKEAISFDDHFVVIVGLSILISIVYSMFVSSLLMLTSIMGKTIKEAQSYSTPIMMLAAFPGMITASMGVNEFTFQHFAIPILNLFSILKELLFGIVNIEHIAIMIVSNLLVMIIVFVIGRVMFMKDKWVMN
ncbi:ABC transporter permease [Bacillus pinisoli]|uniref:ABC transporter permease n=1 Tax=Bacillus pinisoli TaxID=2901866 RepID=UPI001FF49D78|nr:ABC transporter permease subunit [Bacillus pinisoli]